jgi:hypothetical protein
MHHHSGYTCRTSHNWTIYVGSMSYPSLTKQKEAAVDAWLDITSGAGRPGRQNLAEKFQAAEGLGKVMIKEAEFM